MSFFFGKSDSEDNLQYDDTASLHFAISVCIITTITFIGLIYRDIQGRKKPNVKMIKTVDALQPKAKNSLKNQKGYVKSVDFLYKLGIILACVLFGLYCFSNIDQDSKMIGFDPYEILGVSMDAEVITIKKAYRKLALQFHPDRNQNNPQIAAKFIQISKAYECLTDEEAKQKCKKYGNPDGETSFKVGIGLPRFMVDMQNQYFILIPIFIVLLVIIPRAFISWSNRIKPMDDSGNLLVNYQNFFETMIPGMNPITFSVIMGGMKQLDSIFPDKSVVPSPQLEQGMKNLLVNTRAVTPQKVQKIPRHTLHRICVVYSYMANRQKSQKLAELVPQLCRKIVMFAYNFTQKNRHQQMLFNNPNWIINYYGIQPLTLSLFFSKQMFNPSIRLGDTKSIQFLDLTPEQQLLAKNLPIGNLQYNLLWDDQKIDMLVKNFQEDRQKYIKQQVQALPALKIQAKVLLGEQEVNQMTIDDFAVLQIKVIRKKPTPGYVLSKDYPFLAKEQFYIILSYSDNVVLFRPIVFKKGSNQAVFKCTHRQSFVRNMKFDIDVISNCYPNMDLQQELNLNVIGRIQNRKIQIHKDDLNIQKMPKNFFESLASMEAYNESDKQLSQGSDDEGQQKKQKSQKKKGFQQQQEQQQQGQAEGGQNYQQQHQHQHQKQCCDHDH